jgi:ribokinase
VSRVDVVVVGSANIDHVVQVSRLPSLGETVAGDHYFTAPGGKGLNQAVAAARQHASVALIACLGTDEAGDQLARVLKGEGIHAGGLRRTSESPSGVALITVADNGANTVVVAPLANETLTPEDIDAAAGLIAGARVLLSQLEVPAATVARALRVARDAGVTTVLNPAPAPGPAWGQAIPPALVDVLVPNETEATELSGLGAEDAGAALVAEGCGTVVVTIGEGGALVTSRSGPSSWLVPAFAVSSVDSTGAGDAFCGALAAGLAAEEPMATALRRAAAAGALATTARGAVPSLPSAAAVGSFLARSP